MRRISGSFWTPERDRRLQAFEERGLSARAIADKLGTTRNAVLGRSQRLRGLTITYPWYVEKERERRALAEPKRRERDRRARVALEMLRADLAKGAARDVAASAARRRGATYQAIANELGLTRQRVSQIAGERG